MWATSILVLLTRDFSGWNWARDTYNKKKNKSDWFSSPYNEWEECAPKKIQVLSGKNKTRTTPWKPKINWRIGGVSYWQIIYKDDRPSMQPVTMVSWIKSRFGRYCSSMITSGLTQQLQCRRNWKISTIKCLIIQTYQRSSLRQKVRNQRLSRYICALDTLGTKFGTFFLFEIFTSTTVTNCKNFESSGFVL